MAVSENEFRNMILNVITSPVVQSINFTLGSITIDGAGFMQVSAAIASEFVGIDMVVDSKMDPGARLLYNNDGNFIRAPYSIDLDDVETEAAIVHECAHAMHDLFFGGQYPSIRGNVLTKRSENEAAAYIAGFIYLAKVLRRVPHRDFPAFEKARSIALRIKNKPGTKVSQVDEMDLRNLLAAEPNYRDKWSVDDLTIANGPYE